MNITVYLPDELGKRAKHANLPFSQLLRTAVEKELERIEVMEAELDNVTEIELDVESEEGRYTATFDGVKLGGIAELSVYLTDDKRAVLYDDALESYQVFDDVADPSLEESIAASLGGAGWGQYERADYLALMNKLGIKPKLEI